MKQSQQARKPRGRTPSRKQSRGNGGNNRPEVKVRGNPKQLIEKYKTQARDAMQSGDRVQYEYFMQFADHYQRVLNDMRGPQEDSDNRGRRSRSERHADHNDAEGRTASDGEDAVSDEDMTPGGDADSDAAADITAEAAAPDAVSDAPDDAEEKRPRRGRPPRSSAGRAPARSPRRRAAPKTDATEEGDKTAETAELPLGDAGDVSESAA